MEDVDGIILSSLAALGWEPEDQSTSLKNLEPSDIASGIIACLKTLRDDFNFPDKLPVHIAQRFKIAGFIAESIKEFEYPDDIGYQTILYPSETEIRKLFMFLIEKLPKEVPAVSEDSNDRLTLIQKEAKQKISDSLKNPWIPSQCKQVLTNKKKEECGTISVIEQCYVTSKSFCSSEDSDNEHITDYAGTSLLQALLAKHSEQMGASSDTSSHVDDIQLPETKDPPTKDSIPLLISIPQSESVLKFLASTKSKSCNQSQNVDSDDLLQDSGTESMDILKKQVEEISEKIAARTEELEKLNRRNTEIINYKKDLTEKLQKLEKNVETLKKFESVTDSYEDAKKNLEIAIENSKAKEIKRKQQWEEHKNGLEREIVKLQARINSDSTAKLTNEIEQAVLQAKELALDITSKESFAEKLEEQVRKKKNQVSRSSYTQKIVDISGKVRRHKLQTHKVVSDIKVVQKEINTLTGKLQRTFSRVESECYNKAVKDERLAPIYECIVGIHERCGELVEIIRETGSVQREVENLSLQVDTEKAKKIKDKITKLQKDMKIVDQEYTKLAEKKAAKQRATERILS